MNPEQKTEIKLPKFNWDKILVRSSLTMVLFMVVAIITRARTFIVLAEIINVVVILGLLALATWALIMKSRPKK